MNIEESMVQTPKMVKSLATKQVVQIACGRSHSMALTNGIGQDSFDCSSTSPNENIIFFFFSQLAKFILGVLTVMGN